MSETIAACTLIQEEPDRKTGSAHDNVQGYPDVVSVDILQKCLASAGRMHVSCWSSRIKIHSARVGRSYKIPKLCVVEYRSIRIGNLEDAPFKLSCAILAKTLQNLLNL